MSISPFIEEVRKLMSHEEIARGEIIYNNLGCTILSQSAAQVDFIVASDEAEEGNYQEYTLLFDKTPSGESTMIPEGEGKRVGWNRYAYACLLQYEEYLNNLQPKEKGEHKRYTREGMQKRVLEERRQKASKADYHIKWADNIFGDHILTNEKGIKYKIFLRDFENETGYSDSADARYNKLGTTKHIMYAFRKLKEEPLLLKRLRKSSPFVEVYCDPLNNNKISWFHKGEMSLDATLLISKYFKKATYIEEDKVEAFLPFIEEAAGLDTIRIRPEVIKKVEHRFEKLMLEEIRQTTTLDFSPIKAELFPYQREGIEFAVFRKGAIIADEMGLGKTIQAIATAVLKKSIFDFKKTLVVCPATLKSQWKKEIERFTEEKACIVSGFPHERAEIYLKEDAYFFIINYETVLRDSQVINQAGFDFLILDEAQKIKNYETKTASAVKRIQASHKLVITGTPIENRLIDIYSVVNAIDPYFFGPLWEFSYQHCEFDLEKPNKINGYYNLKQLNEQLSDILIRREKSTVLNQLPDVQQIDIPCALSPLQAEYHTSYMKGVASIIRKKFLTPYDLQRLTLYLNCARMVCDSTFLIDEETNESPKLAELEDILFEKLDIQNTNRKIIIFSEWIKVHSLIGQLLRKRNVGFVELNGKVPVKLRGNLIKKFESTPDCKIFLSTEAGGAGLNLQMADILINFELPWNPAKKNQRIGRIDRLGQKSNKLTIYNFITRDSIEQQIAAGLLVKQNLFDGVLSNNNTNYVDFSTKGRSQFIQQIEAFIDQQKQGAQKEIQEEETLPMTETIDTAEADQLSLFEDDAFNEEPIKENKEVATETINRTTEELEQVMNNGMQFLSGLFKMSTGKDMGVENQKIEIDPETGEVVMRFKMKF
ncbi:SNF2 family DNA or RNA helicase [Parabacteroides sp. PFB2-12]|uniref:DEAD/DEAH box helicase n=1 Tax=unclassified Parabacteroides TaxID=2649774 RepID=UPI002475984C|nr:MULTISPECIES: DEAD/DEAH box helicase [unclassified Parabacteroides]MDH6344222.1 SNF2 family DNA or RNA helicase [Parabacteroides sp. PM6-13]MDH6392162.1 SNF2 family DNA or RNA helicase [Parabacteroides sp. PFB2-12]